MRSLEDIEFEIEWRQLKIKHWNELIDYHKKKIFKRKWAKMRIKQIQLEIDLYSNRIDYLLSL